VVEPGEVVEEAGDEVELRTGVPFGEGKGPTVGILRIIESAGGLVRDPEVVPQPCEVGLV
jgi:hypothetical protein